MFLAFFLPSFLLVGFVYADVVVGGGGSYACVSIGTPPEREASSFVGWWFLGLREKATIKKKKNYPPTHHDCHG